ncbi:coiled-coil domain-containing protein 82 [Tiliqua scincoides]|uniref:coiled-coil domain-containing protein 82 n=1 Tax=Tiliqua scincoides TaxID=71010 RepID=UPI003461D196
METNSITRRYETRRSARADEPVAKSRVDWRRTKRNTLRDSEEEEDSDATSTSEKELETSSEEEVGEKEDSIVSKSANETVVDASGCPDAEAGCQDTAAEDAEDESVNLSKRKRSRRSIMYDSEDSDESDIVRKVFAKRSCVIDEEDLPTEQGQQTSPAEEEANRKKQRLLKLQELSQRRPTQTRSCDSPTDSEDDRIVLEDSCPSPFTPAEISDASESDSMKDFIVDDEEGEELGQEKSEDENHLQEKKQAMPCQLLDYHIPSLARVDHSVHFQRVVRAFLINAIDDTFLISLYEGERQKKYAQEMLTSLHFFDERFVQPRLQNLLSRSRWKDRYKERVDTYPHVRIVLGNTVKRSCQACELQRYCRFSVILSGKSYNSETLEIDDFMSHDKQVLKVGAVCGNRTRVYHNLKHFKYKLYKDCCVIMENEGFQDEPVKETVNRVFKQLTTDGWIKQRYTDLEVHMDNADFFQEEKLD